MRSRWPTRSDPGPTITFDKADHDLYDKYYVMGATIARMPTGSSMSLRDALATMLIPSASNYAEAVSTWAFGSQGAFLDAARRWLAAHGLTGTTIVEPTGISARNTSTPSRPHRDRKARRRRTRRSRRSSRLPALSLLVPGACRTRTRFSAVKGSPG